MISKISFITLIVVVALSFQKAVAQKFDFKQIIIGETEELLGQTSLVDVDKDGDLDYIVGSNYGTIWWFEYQEGDKWVQHILGENCSTDAGGVAVDVDGDGWIDQISGQTWYRNTGNPREEQFERYENGAIYAHDNIVADVNGDGKVDLISMSANEGLFWYDFSKAPMKKWKKVQIGEGKQSGIAPFGTGDFDEDGDIDIVCSNVWYVNLEGDGKKWEMKRNLKLQQPKGKFPNASRSWVADMDGDGDMDIVQVSSYWENCTVLWMEKQDVKARTWFAHFIDEDTKQDLQSLCVADYDKDGDMDIFVGGGPHSLSLHKKCLLYENPNEGEKEIWNKHEILDEVESFNAVTGDVDGDGDMDIITKPWKGKTHIFLKNMLIP